jgi:hypothetical protein
MAECEEPSDQLPVTKARLQTPWPLPCYQRGRQICLRARASPHDGRTPSIPCLLIRAHPRRPCAWPTTSATRTRYHRQRTRIRRRGRCRQSHIPPPATIPYQMARVGCPHLGTGNRSQRAQSYRQLPRPIPQQTWPPARRPALSFGGPQPRGRILSRRGPKACTINTYAYPLHVCCLCLLTFLCLLVSMYICHLLMYICLRLWFLMFAYATYVCLCLFIYLLMGYDISEGIFCWTTEYGRKGSV